MLPERKAKLSNFLQFVQRTLFPIESPEEYKELLEKGNSLWTRDWTEIEILKFLLMGEEAYKADPSSHRCRMSSSYNMEEILRLARKKLKIEKDFLLKKDRLPGIIIFENVGRGIDLLLAQEIKSWKKAYCFDSDERYEELIRRYFSLAYEIEFFVSPNGFIIESKIKELGCVVWEDPEGDLS